MVIYFLAQWNSMVWCCGRHNKRFSLSHLCELSVIVLKPNVIFIEFKLDSKIHHKIIWLIYISMLPVAARSTPLHQALFLSPTISFPFSLPMKVIINRPHYAHFLPSRILKSFMLQNISRFECTVSVKPRPMWMLYQTFNCKVSLKDIL
jgi:hypothetical protein